MDHDTDIRPSCGFAPALFRNAWFWALLRWSTLAVLTGVIAVAWGRRGIQGVDVPDPLMYTNLGNLAFWVLWLMGIVLLAPLLGRAWCGACPIGALNEFTARFGLKKTFPRIIRNQYPKVLALLITVLLMGVYRTHHFPDATAWYLLAWAAAAVLAGVLFSGRSLCAYLCPVGGMLGVYGRTAPFRCGVREDEVCRDCENRECVRGAFDWFTARLGRLKVSLRMRKNPCPVNLRVWDMDGTDRCLMCFNCMRACPLDNVAVLGRRPFSSLWTENYPRFSDVALIAALMGFLILSFSRFWPPVQELMVLPVRWLSPYLGTAMRPAALLWLGIGLPLLVIVMSAALTAWGRTGSTSDRPLEAGSGEGSWLRVWFESRSPRGTDDPSGEEKIVGGSTIKGLSAVYLAASVPFVLSSHLVLALVKLNTKLAYLPLAAAEPRGVRSYLAIWELGVIPRPENLFPLSAVRTVSAALLVSGTVLSLWIFSRISRSEGRGALPMLIPMLTLGVVVYGGFYNWLF